jgi:group I intron endonuclease
MIIYKTTNTINGKFYIGQDSNNNPKYLGSGILLNKAIEKYGREYFIKEVLEVCSTKGQLNEREKYWIHELNAKELGYNLADGGFGGNTYTEETRERVSKLLTGRYVSPETIEKRKRSRKQHPERYEYTDARRNLVSMVHRGKVITDETKGKISEKMKLRTEYTSEFLYQQTRDKHGKNSPRWDKAHSDETRKKMSDAHKKNPSRYWKGKAHSPESNEKRRQTLLKFKHTEEHKQKICGEGNPFFGHTHTEETKQKMSTARKLKTPEQKLERYIKFYITRTGTEPSAEQKKVKYQEYSDVR